MQKSNRRQIIRNVEMSHTNSFDVILVISGHCVNGEACVLGQRLHSLCCCRRKLCQRHSRLLLSISPA